jgi:hypothetical protein
MLGHAIAEVGLVMAKSGKRATLDGSCWLVQQCYGSGMGAEETEIE